MYSQCDYINFSFFSLIVFMILSGCYKYNPVCETCVEYNPTTISLTYPFTSFPANTPPWNQH